jgi:FKBP-type peptidyl-prolyl cis-trans isomerase FklB
MKIGMKAACAVMTVAAGVTFSASGVDSTNSPAEQRAKISYSIGVNIGRNIKSGSYDVDLDEMQAAIKDVLGAKTLKLTDEQMREAMMAYQQQVRAKREEERRKTIEKNKRDAETFLAENRKKDGIKTHVVTMPDGSSAEFQYKVLTEGTGPMPKSNDTVSVVYKGTLLNGTEFDSSAKHGNQPAKFSLAGGLVKGWIEALQLMKTGSKWQLFLPPALAYGDRGSGPQIEPGAALIFEIELLGIENPQPPAATAQPLTSDIIRVPSAEELKAGAKIEVLKQEDVEKQLKAATNKPAGPK